jgi:DNA topoisomerase-1
MANKNKSTIMIVESPTKVKTLQKYFSDLKICSTKGHFCQLKRNTSAVKRDGDEVCFSWETKSTQIKEIVNACKSGKYDRLILATDRDREGSGIASHLVRTLKKSKILPEKVERIRFSSMTKSAIQEALDNPSEIDKNLVNAYLTRTAMDFVIGFGFSPLLWQYLGPGLSCGRVQIPTLRILFERYLERKNFKPETSFFLDLKLPVKGKDPIVATLPKQLSQEKLTILKEKLSDSAKVVEIKSKTVSISPKAPFITSSLQQVACSRLSKTVKQVMSLAQKLYEGVEILGEQVPLITYMRTDSLYIHPDNVDKIRNYITNNFPKDYLTKKPTKYLNNSKNTQEAHEAIRPTNIEITPSSVKNALPQDQYELYKIIWERTIASQMTNAKRKTDSYLVENHEKFKFNHSYLTFIGCLCFENRSLEPLDISEGYVFRNCSSQIRKKVTQPPANHSEASLVKKLTEHGTGRPSTYGSIIERIRTKNYVLKARNLQISQLGIITYIFSKLFFEELSEFTFTAKMEENLDSIVNGEKSWRETVFDVMNFVKNKTTKLKTIGKVKVREKINLEWCQGQFKNCDLCGEELDIRSQRSVYLHCRKCKKNFFLDSTQTQQNGIIFEESNQHKCLIYQDKRVFLPTSINQETAFKHSEIFLQLPKIIKKKNEEYQLCSGSRGFFKKTKDKTKVKNTSITTEDLLGHFKIIKPLSSA